MKAGYIIVSKELLVDENWPKIKQEIDKVFTEVCRKEIGSGLIEIHGESQLFDDMPEGATKQYTAIVKGYPFIEVEFIRFE